MKEKFYWLDSLRFFAAFVVVFSHTCIQFQTNYAGLDSEYHSSIYAILYLLFRCGSEAVLVFFVLSGFLVGGKTIEKLQSGTFSGTQYAIDRTVRIVLPLVPALILSYIANTLCGESFYWYEYIGNFLSLQNYCVRPVNGALWSLSSEVWFYIFMFGISLFVAKNEVSTLCLFRNKISFNRKIMGGLIVVISAFVFLGFGYEGLLLWFIGTFAYCLKDLVVSKKRTIGVLFLLPIAEFYYKQTWWKGGLLIPSLPTPSKSFIHIVYAILIAYILCWIIQKVPRRKYLLKMDVLGTKMAKFSYTLYLCHYPFLILIKRYVYPIETNKIDLEAIAVFLIISVSVTVLCYPLYLISEQHTYKIKTYVKKWIKYRA